MIKYNDLLTTSRQFASDILEGNEITYNETLYYALLLTKFIVFKELYIEKDLSNNKKELFFDNIENIDIIPTLNNIAEYVKKQPNSYVRDNNIKIKLKKTDPYLEENIWIINKIRDSISHKKFVIDDEKELLIINNNDVNNPYKLTCSIPLELIDITLDRKKEKCKSNIDLLINETIDEMIDIINMKTDLEKLDKNDIGIFNYLLMFYIDEDRSIDYKYLDLAKIWNLILVKDNSTYLHKRSKMERDIKKFIDEQQKNIYTYQNINTNVKVPIVHKTRNFINETLECLEVINKEKIRNIRNSVEHVNLNKCDDLKFNLIDRKCHLSADVVATWGDKEDIYNLTLDMEKTNLSQLYTLNKLKNNLKSMCINQELLFQLFCVLNDLSNILFGNDIDLNENVLDYINNLEKTLIKDDDKDISVQKVLKKEI